MSDFNGSKSETPVARYQPKPEELAAVQAIATRRKTRSPSTKLAVNRVDGRVDVGIAHPDAVTGSLLMMDAMGSVDHDFVEGIISQLMNAGTKGQEFDGKGPNFMLSVIQGVAPRDEVECMLAVQMAAVHMATMTFARRLAHVENIPQQDAAERAFNKLARTFAVQMEALKRYRTGGEQKVTVHHVTVNEGGQAIVGAVSQTSQTGGMENREASP